MFATLGSARALFIDDRRYRHVAWTLLIAIAAGWWGYFVLLRVPALRITLEVASTLALLLAVLRVRRLMRVHGYRPPYYGATVHILRNVWSVVGSPWVIAAKVWLAAMLIA